MIAIIVCKNLKFSNKILLPEAKKLTPTIPVKVPGLMILYQCPPIQALTHLVALILMGGHLVAKNLYPWPGNRELKKPEIMYTAVPKETTH